MKKCILTALISAGLLTEAVVPAAHAGAFMRRSHRVRYYRGRRRGRRRLRNVAIGAGGGTLGGALIGGGRGAGAGAVIGGAAGALVPTRRHRRW